MLGSDGEVEIIGHFLTFFFGGVLGFLGGHVQSSNLQWILTSVPILKVLILSLSFAFWLAFGVKTLFFSNVSSICNVG